jgi:hypothetical protein
MDKVLLSYAHLTKDCVVPLKHRDHIEYRRLPDPDNGPNGIYKRHYFFQTSTSWYFAGEVNRLRINNPQLVLNGYYPILLDSDKFGRDEEQCASMAYWHECHRQFDLKLEANPNLLNSIDYNTNLYFQPFTPAFDIRVLRPNNLSYLAFLENFSPIPNRPNRPYVFYPEVIPCCAIQPSFLLFPYPLNIFTHYFC